MPVNLTAAQLERRRLLFQACRDIDELHGWVYFFLGVDLPRTIVDPDSTTAPLLMLWEMYSRLMYPVGDETDAAELLYYANREGGKTLTVSIMEVLALLHVKTDVVHLAAQLDQSHVAQRYLKKFFIDNEDLRGLLVGDNVQETMIMYYVQRDGSVVYPREYKLLNDDEQAMCRRVVQRTEITAATMRGTNSKHAGLLVLDELDVLQDPRILPEAKNIPSPIRREDGSYANPLTVYTSTRKTATGPVQEAIDNAAKTGLIVKHFNILEVTQRCPEKRHRPDLPRLTVYRSSETLRAVDPPTYESFDPKTKARYVKDEAFDGCMTNCSIFASCKGFLATRPEVGNEFLKPLSYVVNKIKSQSIDYVRSQLLCLKPSSEGLIWGHLIGVQHVISPAQVYEKIFGRPHPLGLKLTKAELQQELAKTDVKAYGGQDYGFAHDFAFPVGYKFGLSFFVMRCPTAAGLDPGQKLELSEPLKVYDPEAVWGDPESPETIAYFKKHGWRMRTWVKAKGSVVGGIDIIKDKLVPMSGEPELFFVVDSDGDEEMLHVLKMMREWSWKTDAIGRSTNIPTDINKDVPDAVRYVVMNLFPHRRGQVLVASGGAQETPPPAQPQKVDPARPNPEMQRIVSDIMGTGPTAVVTPVASDGKRSRMKFVM